MAKTTKVTSGPKPNWGKLGGKGKMFGEMGANPAKPGQISESQPGKGQKFAGGGGGKMFPQQGAKPAKAGQITESQPGKTPFGVKGGNGHMFGKGSANPAKPA